MTAAVLPRRSKRRRRARTTSATEFDVLPFVDGVAAYLGGNANVLMQLAHPAVGQGVVESVVDSGKVTLHPIKRQRTTLTYLAVAMLGTDAERRLYRDAVNGSHRLVRSNDSSPVEYNAFDPELQLWVAACLYRGFEDAYTALHGPIPAELVEPFYGYGARLGTTLQMSEHMWPSDRAAFEEYWNAGLARIRYDAPVRDYLLDLVRLTYLPAPVRLLAGRFARISTGGFLHPEFREAIGFAWTDRDQREFDRIVRVIAAVNRCLPGPVRRFPFNALLWDMRRRVRRGKPLV